MIDEARLVVILGNYCIDGNLVTYASGGHLWCTVSGTHTFGLKQI